MFALVESGAITSFPKGNRGIKIGDYNYPPAVFTLWSESERNAIGVYTVEIDNTNKKDEAWYVNTNQTYAFGSGKVTATYGTATAKPIADTKWTQTEIDNGDAPTGADTNTVKDEGLKTTKKRIIDNQCKSILAPSDWMASKAFEEGGDVESGWKTWRASVRTKCNSMQTQIGNAANIDALIALFTYVKQEDGSLTRPLGEFPIKE